ncbi:hypothetical protein NA645_01970 [Pseudomonas stutzeri]|uniref:hypothetical protein n=1 Tax=Stutzerimonas stutzeri TaxID=316 RepID=UPI0021093487|nr:hypothetical protein [Stutzerimonas stutzeri]MCQ4306748.1 hypothetical protein [Stutzerimonas stutzeri]
MPDRVDTGDVKEPDQTAIRKLDPDVIIVTARQGEEGRALIKIAPTLDMGINGQDYLRGFERNVLALGSLFDKVPEAKQQ